MDGVGGPVRDGKKKKVKSEKANFGCLAASFKKIMVLEFHSRIRVRHELWS